MIKLENVGLASQEQMEFIIEGMRNPMNSWEKSDSGRGCDGKLCGSHCAFSSQWCGNTPKYVVGEADHSLMQRLSNAGTEHRKYLRMMPVYVRITAPLYWWKEFDTYKVGTVANSCSTMHKIAEKEFTLEDFSIEHICIRQSMDVLKETIDTLNVFRGVYLNGGILRYENGNIKCFGKKDKEIWWQLIQLLPSSYNQTRNVMLNYEVLANIYRQRKNHKLDEWREVCKWIESLPYSELITGLPIESDQAVEEKRFPQPFPWNKDDVYCDNCEHFHDCLNKGGLADVTTSYDIVKNGFGRQHYVNKPGYDCPKKVQSQLAEDDPMSFSVGKIIHDLIAKELTEDVKKQILEEEFGYGKSENIENSRSSDNRCDWCVSMVQFLQKLCVNRG